MAWTKITPSIPHYKTAKRGQLYAGRKGGILAGMLTVHILADGAPSSVAFYSGYMGDVFGVTSWNKVSPSMPTWN